MEFQGICKTLDKIVVSDPSYSDDIWCRYERNDIGGKDWRVHGFVKDHSEEYEGIQVSGKEFFVGLCAPGETLILHEDGSFAHSARVQLNEFEIGMDTACVGLGVNAVADEINASRGEWQPGCCLKTLTDGMFGSVREGVYDDQIRFVVIAGYLDDDTGYSQQDILDYLSSALCFELDRSLDVDELISDASGREQGSDEKQIDKDNIELD